MQSSAWQHNAQEIHGIVRLRLNTIGVRALTRKTSGAGSRAFDCVYVLPGQRVAHSKLRCPIWLICPGIFIDCETSSNVIGWSS